MMPTTEKIANSAGSTGEMPWRVFRLSLSTARDNRARQIGEALKPDIGIDRLERTNLEQCEPLSLVQKRGR